ncbi:rho-related GTP-binding protein Rho6-like [Sinocyclocheilus grahami]|uniref:rho-related GTP-binding protein Rho6-like n=1 Tax=Sinocyclocheilus grahami TaxID=75366 RepID=UPI0007AD4C4C|nr:PREDICTED: rho-related GTP-binding protein Rho6-like [Sinocyclocheilus grahami]
MVDSKAVAVETGGLEVLGSPYYDNVRPLCYSDSDAVLLCFDISRPDIFDSGLKCHMKVKCVVKPVASLSVVSGSPYYDNVRPLCYSDSDAVLLCFDISRPDIFDSGLKKWRAEILDFCPSTRILLVGCKTDLRTDVCTLMELSNQKQTPITHEQGSAMAKQLGAEAYLECSAFTSEKSIHSVFRTAALACINKLQPLAKPSPTRRLSKRLLHLPSKSELLSSTFKKEKAKSCSVM